MGIYPENSSAQTFADLMSKQADNASGSQIILEEIKQIYGYGVNAELDDQDTGEIVARLKQDKEDIETRANAIRTNLVTTLASLFQPAGDTYYDYTTAISKWYTGLHPDQKLETADWQSAASRTVLQALPKAQDVEKLFLETIPAAAGFSLGKVDDWSQDQSASYVNLFKDALAKIETSLPKVPPPIWTTSVDAMPGYYPGSHTVKYSGKVELVISAPGDEIVVRVTRNEDPVKAKQFESVNHQAALKIAVTESCNYQLVSQNSQGDFSQVVRIVFTNSDDGQRLIAENTPKLEAQEREYRFRNPVNKHGLAVLLHDIIGHLKKDQLIPAGDIRAAFEEAVSAQLTDDKG